MVRPRKIKGAKWHAQKIWEAVKYATYKTIRAGLFIASAGVALGLQQAGEQVYLQQGTVKAIIEYIIGILQQAGYNIHGLTQNQVVAAFVGLNLAIVWIIKFLVRYYKLIGKDYKKTLLYEIWIVIKQTLKKTTGNGKM